MKLEKLFIMLTCRGKHPGSACSGMLIQIQSMYTNVLKVERTTKVLALLVAPTVACELLPGSDYPIASWLGSLHN